MSTWLTTLVALSSVLFGGGGLAVLVNAVTGRRPRRAEVADRLSESTLKWVEQFQEESAAARREAAEARAEVAAARREAAETRRELDACRREIAAARTDAEQASRQWRSIQTLIHTPSTTIDYLRAIVPGPTNGRAS